MLRILGALLAMTLSGLPALGAAGAEGGDEAKGTWSFSAAAFAYFVPDDDDFVLPVLAADRGGLHLEARYRYEAPDTGSVWLGGNLSGGDDLEWEVTPMIGGLFGDVHGVAPGYKGSLAWRRLELYSEGEYVFDTGDSSENFFYNWSELTYAPWDRFRFGLVTQRTRAYEADREIERGLLVGFTWGWIDTSAYVFYPEEGDPTVVVAVALDF